MSSKLIDINALSEFKDGSDAKYQDKLTAGDNISISNGVISAKPTLVTTETLGITNRVSTANNTITKLAEVTLQPGIYFIAYTCYFASNATGYRACGFSTTMYLDSLGVAYADWKRAASGSGTCTRVTGVVEVSASSYPNGRTFNLLGQQNSGGALNASPRLFYVKF